jgi:hypothetical protein
LKGGTAHDGPISASACRQATDEEPERKAEYFPNAKQECKLYIIKNSLNYKYNILTTRYKFLVKE